MLVSIVTSCYNSEKFISQTYESILFQTYTNWEWIVIDDNSKDNSFEILSNISKTDNRIKLFKNSFNCGSGFSRNRGIEYARGNYLTFIDSDDIWYPNFIENSLKFMISNKYNFTFSSYKRQDETLSVSYKDFNVPDKINYHDLLKSCPISCLTAFINLNNLPKLYMPNYNSRQDYALWLNYLKLTPYAYGLNEILAIYRIRNNSLSRNKYKAGIYQFLVYYEYLNLNIFRSIYFLFFWFIRGIKKYFN